MPLNLINDVHSRNERRQTKQRNVLRFLREQLWSTQDILQEVMGLASRQAAHKSLTQMQKEGLVKVFRINALGGDVTIWGITAHGQFCAFEPTTEEPVKAYFEPMRVSELTLRHQIELQRLRLTAEKHGWTSWRDGDRLGALPKEIKRPDAVAITRTNRVIAVECERTFKTLKRYEQILVSYLRWLKKGDINHVVWVLPTEDMCMRLRKVICGIKTVSIAGQRVLIDPTKHHQHLYFCSYSKWPSYEG